MQRVVRITSGFQQEAPLNLSSKDLISQLFEKGWPNPEKINSDSREVALLLNEARNSFAKYLQVEPEEIHFLGEVNLGFHLGLTGLLNPGDNLIYSEIDKQEIFAVADSHEKSGGKLQRISVSNQGLINEFKSNVNDVICWQVVNGETGIIQRDLLNNSRIFADCTSSGVDHLPTFKYQSALFDSRSWQGPVGLGILIVKNDAIWRNPLPHNDHTKVPNSYSVPLVLASALAIETYMAQQNRDFGYREVVLKALSSSNLDFYTPTSVRFLARNLSLVFPDLEADRLVLVLQDLGFAVDSGSACRSADMVPSHVLSAMGAKVTGNIRITFHQSTTAGQVSDLANALVSAVKTLRGI